MLLLAIAQLAWATTPTLVRTIRGHDALALSSDGKRLAMVRPGGLSWSPDSQRLAALYEDGSDTWIERKGWTSRRIQVGQVAGPAWVGGDLWLIGRSELWRLAPGAGAAERIVAGPPEGEIWRVGDHLERRSPAIGSEARRWLPRGQRPAWPRPMTGSRASTAPPTRSCGSAPGRSTPGKGAVA